MTILNVHIERERAIVTANTEVVWPGGKRTHADKLFPLPNVNCVVAGRGDLSFLINVFCQSYSLQTDFDGMAAQWSDLLSVVVQRRQSMPLQQGACKEAEIVLVGWSASRKEMVCYYAKVEEDGAFELHDVKEGVLMPWESSWGKFTTTSFDRAALISEASLQSMLGEEDHPGKCWRGDLTIAEITLGGIHLTSAREFWK